MAVKISTAQVNAFRLKRQHLSQKATKRDLAKVVSDVCGVQAQVLSAAELAVRARVADVNQRDVREALWRRRTLVKTWCMRGTLHLLASSDLPLYVAAMKTKLEETVRWLHKTGGVSGREVASVSAAIGEALSKKALSREELSLEVERETTLRPWTRKALMSAWGILLRPAAYQGLLAFGENVGPKVRFVNPAAFVKPWKEPSAREALTELFRRFLRAYGPAKTSDFGRWWGGLGNDGRSVLASVSAELEEVELEGHRGLMLKEDAQEAVGLEPPSGSCLLPSFDCYAMHYSPREIFATRARDRIFSKEAGWVFPSVVIDGVAAGVWSVRKRPGRVEVVIEAFRALSSREKGELAIEGADVGRFLGGEAVVRYGSMGRS